MDEKTIAEGERVGLLLRTRTQMLIIGFVVMDMKYKLKDITFCWFSFLADIRSVEAA